MDIQKQAQRFAEILLTSGLKGEWDIPTNNTYEAVASDAWRMADAMQAEADKRTVKGVPEAIQQHEKEWQPDWSVAPSWAIAWAMDMSGECYWHNGSDHPTINNHIFESSFDGHTSEAPCFEYTGSWQDSLRKRP